MDNSFHKKKPHELVFYQAITRRRRQTGRPAGSQDHSFRPRIPSISPLEIKPDVKRVFKKLIRQVFYQNDWWSAIHSDKGLIIDLQV